MDTSTMYLVLRLPVLLLVLLPLASHAATLTVDVRNARNQPVRDAVVYAIPDGKTLPLAKKTAVMDQKNRTFIPHILPIQTGTSVRFPNSDDIRHQVYSFSTAKTFQLPLYTGTPSNPIVFDKPGVATLGCNIHDRMSAYIVVVDTPHFEATGGNGRATLDNLGAGKYTVHVWHPQLRAEPVSVTLTAAQRHPMTISLR
jgi:plastocyanin